MSQIIELDARRRAPLAKVLKGQFTTGQRFRVWVEPDGTIYLVPIAAREA